MTPLRERVRTRIPSVPEFLRRAAADPRRLTYDLLPIASTPAVRARIAGIVASFRPKTPAFMPSDEARAWHRALETDGITGPLPILPAAWVAAMRRYCETVPCHDP